MGFLENLIKRETRKIVSNVVDNVVGTVVDSVNDVINPGGGIRTAQEEYEAMKAKASSSSSITDDKERQKWEASMDGKKRVHVRLTEIVAEQWPDYELRQNVAASEFAAEQGARKYSYVLYNNGGVPVLSIMVIDNSNHYRKKEVVLAHEASEKKGVPCINIMSYLPSERSYIYGRLKEVLG